MSTAALLGFPYPPAGAFRLGKIYKGSVGLRRSANRNVFHVYEVDPVRSGIEACRELTVFNPCVYGSRICPPLQFRERRGGIIKVSQI